jgi:hypothetical protein
MRSIAYLHGESAISRRIASDIFKTGSDGFISYPVIGIKEIKRWVTTLGGATVSGYDWSIILFDIHLDVLRLFAYSIGYLIDKKLMCIVDKRIPQMKVNLRHIRIS